MSVGLIAGVLAVVLVAALALHRPVLARLGHAHALARRRHFALVAVGLMAATAVVTGAGVTADSVHASTTAAVTARLDGTDVAAMLHAPAPTAFARAVLDAPDVASRADASAVALRFDASAENARTRLGEPEITVWGVDPASFTGPAALDALAGGVPADAAAWPADALVVNADLAERLQADVGDAVSLFVRPPPRPVPQWSNHSGTLVAASRGADGAYVHPEGDAPAFTVNVPPRAFGVRAFVIPDRPGTDFDLEAESPDGTRHLADEGTPAEPDFANLTLARSNLTSGEWTFRVHAKAAANASFRLAVLVLLPPDDAPPAAVLEGRVAAIVANAGSDPVAGGPAAFVALPILQDALDARDLVNVLLVSARDDVPPRDLASAVESAVAANAEDATLAGPAGPPGVRVRDLRTDALERAEQERTMLKVMFLTFGAFTVIAGLFLIVSLVTMLVEERKADVATLRATGALRGHVTRWFVHEATLYAVAAAALGLLAGVGLAWGMVRGASTFSFYQDLTLALAVRPLTLFASAGAGFALTTGVAAVAAHRAGGFNVALALRGESAAPRRASFRARVGRGVLLLAGVALTGAAAVTRDAVLLVAGPSVLALGVATVAARRFRPERVNGVVGAALLAYVTGTFFFLTDLDGDAEFLLIPVRGLLLTVAATLALVATPLPARAAAWLAGRWRRLDAVADAAFAYAVHRRARTGLTVATLGLVMLILVAMGSVYAMLAPDEAGAGAGFDVVGTTRERVDDPHAWLAAHAVGDADPFADATLVVSVPVARGAAFDADPGDGARLDGWGSDSLGDVVGVTPAFADAAAFAAVGLDPAHASARDALQAIAADPARVAVSENLRVYTGGEGGGRALEPGDALAFTARDGTRLDLTVIAVVKGGLVGGLLVHPDVADALPRETASRVLVRVAPSADADAVARDVEAAFRPAGMDATSVAAAYAASQADTRTQMVIMQAFIGIGLVIGIAAIGIVTARNVLERRREIGVLRALGAGRGRVTAMLVMEVLFVVTLAVLIGLAGGLLTAYGAFVGEFRDHGATFTANPGNLALLVGIVYAAGLAAALAAARGATRITPAEATRYAD